MITKSRQRRKKRIRAKVSGTKERPRLSIYRSNKRIYAQIIDDAKGNTLVSAGGESPSEVGGQIAKRAKAKKITKVVFDRGGYKYHGRVKTLADSARKGGLRF